MPLRFSLMFFSDVFSPCWLVLFLRLLVTTFHLQLLVPRVFYETCRCVSMFLCAMMGTDLPSHPAMMVPTWFYLALRLTSLCWFELLWTLCLSTG